MEKALNEFLMTYCYTHRLVHCLTLIKEASYWSRWRLTQSPTIGQCTENERLSTAQSQIGRPYHPPTTQGSGMADRKRVRGRGGG